MKDYLIQDATRNVWCNPFMDVPSIFKLHRVTNKNGAINSFTMPWEKLDLPTCNEYYDVYHIGQLPTSVLGIEKGHSNWQSVMDISNRDSVHIDTYVNKGVELCKSQTYIKRTTNHTIFVAVRRYAKQPDIINSALYIRFYSNSYLASNRAPDDGIFLRVAGGEIDTVATKLAILNDFYTTRLLEGSTYLQLNGIERGYLTPAEVNVGDVLELTYDSTVYRSFDYVIDDLDTFTSTLDKVEKYLLRTPKYDNPVIDYRDDVDVQLLQHVNESKGSYIGIKYHFNLDNALRHVTHQDYSIPTSNIQEYLVQNPDLITTKGLVLRLNIKRSGYHRPLTFNKNKVHELYKLPDSEITGLLLGIDSNIPEWTAANLESSGYTAIMRSLTSVDINMVVNGYGYNAISKLVANSPISTRDDGGTLEVTLPFALRTNSTIYEYDVNGILLGWMHHTSGVEHYPVNAGTTHVEALRGYTGPATTDIIGEQFTFLDDAKEYRFYIFTSADDSGIEGYWKDVTNEEGYYRIHSGGIEWLKDIRLYTPLVRDSSSALGFDTFVSSVDGTILVNLKIYNPDYAEGINSLQVPRGKTDVWLNGHPLIRELDFVIDDDAKVWITNKEYIVDGYDQLITFRSGGFCNSDLTPSVITEMGHIRHGFLSRNSKFDVRDDRVFRCLVGGSLKTASDITFSESNYGVMLDKSLDGTPYIIEYEKIPLWELKECLSQEEIDAAYDLNNRVSALLTLRLPEPDISTPIFVEHKHMLYSPFIGKILADMLSGALKIVQRRILDDELVLIAAPYIALLKIDPALKAFNNTLTAFQPHPWLDVVSLSIFQYTVLDRLSQMYLDGKVDITQFVTVGDNSC